MSSYFFLLKEEERKRNVPVLSHYVSIGNGELMWKLGQSSSKPGEAISAVIVQKAVSGLCLAGFTNCFLKIGKKTTPQEMIQRGSCYTSFERSIDLCNLETVLGFVPYFSTSSSFLQILSPWRNHCPQNNSQALSFPLKNVN